MQRFLQPLFDTYWERRPNPWRVSNLLSPVAPADDPARLYEFYSLSNAVRIPGDIRSALGDSGLGLSSAETGAWTDIFVTYWKAVGEILSADEATNLGKLREGQLSDVFEAWKGVVNTIIKHISNGATPPWNVVCMYQAASHLRTFAIKADEQLAATHGNGAVSTGFQDDAVSSQSNNKNLTEATRVFARIFHLCLNDRTPDMQDSRKWGTYYMANLQFRTYFKLKAISLSKNVVKSIEAQTDLPPFEAYPKAHRVTYKYYVGVLCFLQEDYQRAEACLTEAFTLCHRSAMKNRELILTYLIPCSLITKQSVPSSALLKFFPRLQSMFSPLIACIKRGDLPGFDQALVAGEEAFVKHRLYLTLERARDIALRNLLRKVFIAGGYEDLKEGQTEADRVRKSRIPIANFAAALRMGTGGEGSGQVIDDEEVECMLANMIYKGFMKGYISREHAMVVVNKKGGAFPGTGV